MSDPIPKSYSDSDQGHKLHVLLPDHMTLRAIQEAKTNKNEMVPKYFIFYPIQSLLKLIRYFVLTQDIR